MKNLRVSSSHFLGLFAVVILAVAVQAQEEEKSRVLLRILPLGEEPTFKSEIKNGILQEQAAPPGSIPPAEIRLPGVGGDEDRSLRLKLGTISPPVVAVPGAVPLKEVGPGGVANPGAWHNLPMPEHSAGLALLWRDRKEGNWSKARSKVLADDVVTFPAGRVRIVNVSPFEVWVIFQGKEIILRPGMVAMEGVARTPLKQAPLAVAVVDAKGRRTTVYHGAINQTATERTNIVIYRADGPNPRGGRLAKVLPLRERAWLPPLPRKKEER